MRKSVDSFFFLVVSRVKFYFYKILGNGYFIEVNRIYVFCGKFIVLGVVVNVVGEGYKRGKLWFLF